MAKQGSVSLRGRFRPGSKVRLVKVEGAHVLRPGPQHEVVDTQTVDDDGCVTFSKGVEVDERYFAVGNVDGQPVEVRLRGRSKDDVDVVNTGYDPQDLRVRTRLSDGSFVDEPPEQHQKVAVEGATWLGQHQVPKGTLQRSDTPRGAASVISAEEVARATKQWRKQEPTDQVIEETPDADENPARTAEPTDETPAKAKAAAKTTAKAAKEASK